MKDSSSDVSPRDSSSSALADRRRQRRRQASSNDREYDNQAYADDEPPLPTHIEQPNDNVDEQEEQNVHNADRLVAHVAKQHHRVVNEVQQQGKRSKKRGAAAAAAANADNEQEELNEQIRHQQDIISRRIGQSDDERTEPVEPLPPLNARGGPDRSIDQLLDRAAQSAADREWNAPETITRRFSLCRSSDDHGLNPRSGH